MAPDDNLKNKYATHYDVMEHKILSAVVVLVECFIKSHVFRDDSYGVECGGGRIMISKILDEVNKSSGIDTSDTRKRGMTFELARIQTLAFACWLGMTSPLSEYLFYHSSKTRYTEDKHNNKSFSSKIPGSMFIGFNSRIVTQGIFPNAVITKDQVFDSIFSTASCHVEEHLNDIIETFAFEICHIERLDPAHFRVKKSDPLKGDELDYRYICISNPLNASVIYSQINHHLEKVVLSEAIINKIIGDLSRSYRDLPMLRMGNHNNKPYLFVDENEPKTQSQIAIIEGPNGSKKQYSVCLSVSYLKDKYPLILTDDIISPTRIYDSISDVQVIRAGPASSCSKRSNSNTISNVATSK